MISKSCMGKTFGWNSIEESNVQERLTVSYQNCFLHNVQLKTSSTPVLDCYFFPSSLAVCGCVFEQAHSWGYTPASPAVRAYRVRRSAGPATGDTALTAAVTSAARCLWTCALACVQDTAATLFVFSASACWTAVSPSLEPETLKLLMRNVSWLITVQHLCCLCFYARKPRFKFHSVLETIMIPEQHT